MQIRRKEEEGGKRRENEENDEGYLSKKEELNKEVEEYDCRTGRGGKNNEEVKIISEGIKNEEEEEQVKEEERRRGAEDGGTRICPHGVKTQRTSAFHYCSGNHRCPEIINFLLMASTSKCYVSRSERQGFELIRLPGVSRHRHFRSVCGATLAYSAPVALWLLAPTACAFYEEF
jgi:SET domain-containing protein